MTNEKDQDTQERNQALSLSDSQENWREESDIAYGIAEMSPQHVAVFLFTVYIGFQSGCKKSKVSERLN